jgi:UDP-glucose 4-epimerase
VNVGVIGSNGFVGRNLCSEFLKTNDSVFAFFNHDRKLIPNGCIIQSINKPFNRRLDVLIFCIGNHGSTHSDYIKQLTLLSRIVRKVEFSKIIMISSIAVYGNHNNVIHYKSCYNNPGLYGVAKLAQEFIIMQCSSYAIIRPTYLYGNGMANNSLMPTWISNAIKEKKIDVYGNGLRKQDYLHINDLTSLCRHAANDNTNNTVIAATGKSITNLQLANEISQLIPNVGINFAGEDTAPSFEFDITNTTETYNWQPKVSINDGLMRLINNENINI